jgi:hypothetical protein
VLVLHELVYNEVKLIYTDNTSANKVAHLKFPISFFFTTKLKATYLQNCCVPFDEYLLLCTCILDDLPIISVWQLSHRLRHIIY